MSSKNITIYGAGISGLSAAINLAKNNFNVEVREKRGKIGGSSSWHPSVHQQAFDLAKTSEYIDIDITPCFQPVTKHTFYFYGRKVEIHAPVDSYVCEKGQRPSSIESYLYSEAKNIGVRFVFGEAFDPRNIERLNKGAHKCIVATGLEDKAYRELDIKYASIQGFRSHKTASNEDFAISYFGKYTNDDFAYLASCGDLLFCLLFSRRGVSKNNLEAFQRHLFKSENFSFDDWHFSSGCVPLEKNFVKKGAVLAGTISGMIDPFYLNGISAALISGKIAALYFTDRKRAFREFKLFSRNFYIKKGLKLISEKLPVKKFSFPLIAQINNRLKWVGVI
ncbi:hypothetical protein ES705_11590 [subsurface metagenome]